MLLAQQSAPVVYHENSVGAIGTKWSTWAASDAMNETNSRPARLRQGLIHQFIAPITNFDFAKLLSISVDSVLAMLYLSGGGSE